MIDDAVGRVIAALRKSGLADNTIIAFTSDHGDYLGDHGLLLKGPLHLHSLIRVPLIWCDPTARTNGEVSQALCSSMDISATILDRVGIEPYNGMQGRSLLPVINKKLRHPRSEERRVGKAGGINCRSRWSRYHKKKKKNKYHH